MQQLPARDTHRRNPALLTCALLIYMADMSPSRGLFDGLRVACAAVTSAEGAPLQDKLARGGAVLVDARSCAGGVDVVVTRSWHSAVLRACRSANPGVLVVTPEWATASLATGRRLPCAAHALPCFSGLTVCLSGMTSAAKQKLVALVEAHGGHHSSALDRRCTHLVTCTTSSDKYRCDEAGSALKRAGTAGPRAAALRRRRACAAAPARAGSVARPAT